MIDFHKLATLVGAKEVRSVLEWYDENIGGEYIPVAHSGKSFREKYDRLKAAMERDNVKRKPVGFTGDKKAEKFYEEQEVVKISKKKVGE